MKKHFTKAFGVAILASSVAYSAFAADYTLRLAHALTTSEPMHAASEFYAERVKELSDGRIEIEVFPNSQLGSNLDVYEQVRMGSPIIQISDPGYLSDYVPDFGVLNGPYLLDDPADFQKLLDSDWYKGIVEELAQKDKMRVLSLNWLFGARDVIANKEIREPADMKNLSIRVPPNVMWIETFKALGARGETLAWAEVYPGLESGVVEAAEAPLSSLYGSKLYESAKTISMTNHFTAFTGPIINEDVFNSMPEDLQQILLDAAVEAGDYMAKTVTDAQGELRTNLEAEGVTFVDDVDYPAFREATAVVYDQFPDWSPDLYKNVRAILDQ